MATATGTLMRRGRVQQQHGQHPSVTMVAIFARSHLQHQSFH
jgi:hypothetical protein